MSISSRTVSAIVPCRNERRYIEAFCRSVCAQVLPAKWSLQLVIADGLSDDGTREMLKHLSAADPRVQCIDNPKLIVSAGLNRALSRADGEVIVRMDVHTDYATDYIAQCISVLAETGADNVGGAWRAVPDDGAGPMQQAVAAAFQSRWVAGGALSRRLDHDGWVDTVYLGCWPRATFERFGGFDESLARNQDDEHNLRLVRGGGRVWQSSRIRSTYHPRASLSQVFRQYFQYGYWKPFVMKKHRQAASLRHLAPVAFVGALVLLSLVALLGAPAWPLAACLLLYLGAVGAMTGGVLLKAGVGISALSRVPMVIAAYHFGYGLGSLLGFWDVLRGGRANERFAALTR
ncbi:glycosyltransferase family 2 protein [Variovorax sp. LjRoot130]|uniref:glycosyltransferase family 2 protein n=1 Tax=Variovorax sp. LjRoot130 TaxID=3342261 RepID=UPI003ECF47E7